MHLLRQPRGASAGTAREDGEALHQGLDRMGGVDRRQFTLGTGLWTCRRNHKHPSETTVDCVTIQLFWMDKPLPAHPRSLSRYVVSRTKWQKKLA